MTQLLVSVRDVDEAAAAIMGGADIIDLKEPQLGSLGPVSAQVAQNVTAAMACQAPETPLSLAMGELLEHPADGSATQLYRPLLLREFRFAKVGLAACAGRADWKSRWLAWRGMLPNTTRPVVVAYADPAAEAPAPTEIVNFAVENQIPYLLVDTFDKARGDLFRWTSLAELSALIRHAQSADVRVALAGSLSTETVGKAKVIAPDLVAVRGAVCRGGRSGKICANRVQILQQILKAHAEGSIGAGSVPTAAGDSRK